MALKFIINTQLPPVLANYLVTKGYDAIHTTHFPNGHLLQDSEIVVIATSQERIITTKDSDFFDHFILKGAPPKILLLQFGNIKNSDLLAQFDYHLEKIVACFEEGAEMITFDRTQIINY